MRARPRVGLRVSAVLYEFLEMRDLDAQRIGLPGVSLGVYAAPRAAAFD